MVFVFDAKFNRFISSNGDLKTNKIIKNLICIWRYILYYLARANISRLLAGLFGVSGEGSFFKLLGQIFLY